MAAFCLRGDMQADTSYLCIADCLKATLAEEGGERFVYLEASNEQVDQQGEVVLAKALEESASYFLRYGNLDLDHLTQIGLKAGVADYHLYEIGRPVEVSVMDGRTLVKGQIYRGDGPAAERANAFWASLTELQPPARWYPSVGGQVIEKGTEVDPDSGARRSVIGRVRWTNVGFSKTPVNQAVPTVTTVPFAAFAKSWGPAGLDLAKALEAGYGADVATLTGGAALRRQSLDGAPADYPAFRQRLAAAIRAGRLGRLSAARLAVYAARALGLTREQAVEWVERFLTDLRSKRTTR
jgi:hypothetical protein